MTREEANNPNEKLNNSNDLISRQAALKCAEMDSEIYIAINNLPSAQPSQIARDIATIIENEMDMRVALKNAERKKGQWLPEFNGQFKGGAYWFFCSLCKRIVPEVRNGGWNYCPSCGADMRETE